MVISSVFYCFRLKNIIWYHQKPFTKNNSNWCWFWSGPPVCKYDLGIHSIEKNPNATDFQWNIFLEKYGTSILCQTIQTSDGKKHRKNIEILSCHGEGNSGKPIRFIAILPAYPGTTSFLIGTSILVTKSYQQTERLVYSSKGWYQNINLLSQRTMK